MKHRLLYGLVGYPLEHSFSPQYFNAKFAREKTDAVYLLFPLQNINELHSLIALHPGLAGLNITIPYKQAVIPLLDAIDDNALAVGAVNCITINNGLTKGYNTDVIGFEQSLVPLLTPGMNSALVLGTGGAAKAVCRVLQKLGIDYIIVSRTAGTGVITYKELTGETIATRRLIINTTPLGMHPLVEDMPEIPYEYVGGNHLLYDLVYNPGTTKFMQAGILQGAAVKNGLEMLHLQAEAAWQRWTAS